MFEPCACWSFSFVLYNCDLGRHFNKNPNYDIDESVFFFKTKSQITTKISKDTNWMRITHSLWYNGGSPLKGYKICVTLKKKDRTENKYLKIDAKKRWKNWKHVQWLWIIDNAFENIMFSRLKPSTIMTTTTITRANLIFYVFVFCFE